MNRPFGLLLLAVAAFTLSSCKRAAEGAESDSAGADSGAAAPSSSSAPLSLPVAAAAVRQGDLVLTIATTGQVASEGQALLRSEITGTVAKVLVRAGDRVKAGQALLQIDPRSLDIALAEAEANVERARVSYRDTYYPDSVVTGRAPTEEQRRTAMARSGLQSALVALDRAKYEREKATVVSPFDGMVDRVDVAAGMRLSTGENMLRVVSLGLLRIEAQVLEHDLALIKEGGEAIVTSSADRSRPIRGRIAAVLPMVDTTTRSGRAYVRLPANSILRPGMYADVRLEAQRLSNRIMVPTRAIIQRDGRPLVFVVKDGRAQWVYINPGRSNGIDTEVLPDSGTGLIPVAVGDEVVVDGHLTLTHDAQVRVVNADTSSTAAVRKEE